MCDETEGCECRGTTNHSSDGGNAFYTGGNWSNDFCDECGAIQPGSTDYDD